MIISLDTECTGLDLVHGAAPFLVTWCEVDQGPCFVEWDVDPLTRKPQIPNEDIEYIVELLDAAETIYLQNAKFDARALATIGIDLPWDKVRDTLVMGHLLASNEPHNLTDMVSIYLGKDIEPLEVAVKKATQECRKIVKRDYPSWRVAEEGEPDMPSVKGGSKRDDDKPWKNDMWLLRALAKARLQVVVNPPPVDPVWLTACSRYANGDSEYTLYLGLEMERLIREHGLWAIYEHRLRLPRIACDMECYGVTARGDWTVATITEYETHIAEAADALVGIAAGYGHKLELAQGATLNDNMRDFFYGAWHQSCPRCVYFKRVKHWNGESLDYEEVCPKCAKRKKNPMRHQLVTTRRDNLKLPIIWSKKTGNATLDKDAMQEYLQTLDEGPALDFIELLADKRLYDTALSYMLSYQRFWVPCEGAPGYYRIHPSLNPCGTDHLRWSSNSPNMQNVSGESKEISNRACFGPAPGREWWRMDFKSIERRIPAYESGEPKMVQVFEHPNEAPYWGNLYCLTASVLYPDIYWPLAETEGLFRKDHPKLYKQAKFFDLAKQYGCGRRKGDLLSRVTNSFDLVDSEFPLLAKIQAHYLRLAERRGYVETLPDTSVDPERGYPILARQTEDGRVLSTTPFNYHVSGTACWVKNMALIRCSDQLEKWRNDPSDRFDGHIALEIHDEILFDFPRGATLEENRWRALVLKKLMEESGDTLIPRIPTPVSVEYHIESWAKGVTL